MEQITTYTQLVHDKRLFDLCQEATVVYNTTKNVFWKHYDETGKWLNKYELQKVVYHSLKSDNLSSNTKIAIIQSFRNAVKSYNAARKEYKKNPTAFSGEPRPPTKDKTIYSLIFKASAIKFKKGKLRLSLKCGKEAIAIPWSIELGKPVLAIISWKPTYGWKGSFVVSKNVDVIEKNSKRIMTVDLGNKRSAATFDGKEVVTYSGKIIKSLIRLQNKCLAKKQQKQSKCTKHSRKYKHIQQGYRKQMLRIANKKKDILHKTSRTMVNDALKKDIETIVFGDCAGIHTNTNLGKENNQQVQQTPSQQLRKYVEYKFTNVGGKVDLIPEYYTSKECPICATLNKPKNRRYHCKECNYDYDRDGVGSINMYCRWENVSFGQVLDVVGSLTEPVGWKYVSNRACLVRKH